MNLLLDTHVYLWWLTGSRRLSALARDGIADPNRAVYVSAVSIWEARIKERLGRLDLGRHDLVEEIAKNDFLELPISAVHGRCAGRLPPHHDDPFDRMLVAQAATEGLSLVSRDRALSAYEVSLLW